MDLKQRARVLRQPEAGSRTAAFKLAALATQRHSVRQALSGNNFCVRELVLIIMISTKTPSVVGWWNFVRLDFQLDFRVLNLRKSLREAKSKEAKLPNREEWASPSAAQPVGGRAEGQPPNKQGVRSPVGPGAG